MRSRVDLPQPEGPTKTTNSPAVDVEIDALDHLDGAEGFAYTAQFQPAHPPVLIWRKG